MNPVDEKFWANADDGILAEYLAHVHQLAVGGSGAGSLCQGGGSVRGRLNHGVEFSRVDSVVVVAVVVHVIEAQLEGGHVHGLCQVNSEQNVVARLIFRKWNLSSLEFRSVDVYTVLYQLGSLYRDSAGASIHQLLFYYFFN